MTSEPTPIEAIESVGDIDAVRALFKEYADSLEIDLGFQNFEAELADLPGDYAPPRGALFLARTANTMVGCCALRPLDTVDYPNACEMKRLYVRPGLRGKGLGRRLAEAVLLAASQAGYAYVLLDTLSEMETARAMYQELGFVEVAPYYFNPIEGAHYLMARL
ncbi:MAG: GNAT family N-acetyltransferase [Comamonadaceae bacterium CG_4_9_14_3_um_filter_60_33]|nr:MAG: GNAT family N-acetyltransferase [Comamonadaceae bacterium CG2_30_59_20]PIY29216.1 MAG: GNAT family N-acetyltransferase [Comamonadaceae bacterium CG_4_10_14_3_um_filter_60_42]PJB41351.1 MAG: GNAT family N-acetyltransferase [Comamonadaceae bacterium CG_4_9_14_3_um_filter_60_33]